MFRRERARMNSTLLSFIPVATLALPLVQAAEIAGRVTDAATAQPLRAAIVSLPELGATTVADRAGEFRFVDVPAGRYTLTVEYVGYGAGTRGIEVADDSVYDAPVALGALAPEEVTVVGYRAAQAAAIQDKKAARLIKDSVTGDDVGKLPDRNAAEALQRLPGVSVALDQGEGRYVIIRGIDPSYNVVTLDNQVLGVPEGDTRRIALDTVPADLLGKLEVIKAVTPDMDGNAVGGSINIVTPSAFDAGDGQFFTASADFGYYDLNGDSPYGGSAAWGKTFGADATWGVVLAASYLDRNYESQNVQGNTWEEEGDFFIPEEQVLRDYELERIRKGFVANLEFRPNDDVKLYWRNLWNQFQDTETRAQTVYDYVNGDLENQTPTSGTFTEGGGERLLKERLEKQTILSSSLGGEFRIGAWGVGLSGTYGEAEQDTPFDNEWSFELDGELPMSYDTSDFFFTVDAGPEFSDPDNYAFNEVSRASQLVKEDLRIGQLDLTRDLDFGATRGFLKFGAKYINREKTSDQDADVYDGYLDDLILTDFSRPGKSDYYSSERSYEFGPVIDYGAVEGLFAQDPGGFERSDADSIEESFGVDYRIKEDVSAGYVMAALDFDRLSLIGGVRVERTETEFSAFELIFEDGDIGDSPPATTGTKDYTDWLPGLQARFAARENLLLRAAWTNTIGRPAYELTVPFRIFEIDPDGDDEFEGALATGNPDLDPLESMNLDASIEWYLNSAGIVALGVFYKDIDNPIYTRVTELEDQVFEGRFFTELEIERPENADSGEILGVELNYQNQFRSLPSPFDGFGISLNYTWTDSEARVFDRDGEVPFFLQSENIGNVAIFFEKYGFAARLALNYRSEYLDSLGDDVETDIYVAERQQLDFKASYAFTPGFSVFVEALNILDEPLRFTSGNRSRLAENEIYSWNALVGVQLKF